MLDYEIGVKSDWELLGMPLRTNLALYQTAYHNIQVQQQVPNVTLATGRRRRRLHPGAVQCRQCASAPQRQHHPQCQDGAGSMARNGTSPRCPTDWLTLNASGSYIDPRYTDFTFIAPPGYLQPTGSTNLSGTPIPVPAWQTNETATVNFGDRSGGLPLGDTDASRRIITGRAAIWRICATYNPSQRTFAYGLLNFRLDFTDVGTANADLALFMNNVANTQACLPEYNGVLNSAPNGTFGTPGTSGVLQCIPLAAAHDGRDGDLQVLNQAGD